MGPDIPLIEKPKPLSTKERLARDIEALAKAMQDPELMPMIRRAREGYYDDYETTIATPQMALANDFRSLGYEGMMHKAMDGRWDSTKEEGAAWAAAQTDPELVAALEAVKRIGQFGRG